MGQDPGGRRRRPRARPRYRRIAAAATSVLITLVAVLGASGIIPANSAPRTAWDSGAGSASSAHGAQLPSVLLTGSASASLPRYPAEGSSQPRVLQHPGAPSSTELPARSGNGKRIVFDIGAQRVWLVSGKGRVQRTYLVSGSLTDNLAPGRYEVYSKSVNAVGIDDSGTMKYMVRFAHGKRAAIGFHDIPVRRGEKVQTRAELGRPQSHGCIRQLRKDAKALWEFAPIGTEVVVLD